MAVTNPVSGTFTGTGQSDTLIVSASKFDLSVSGFGAATVVLERSFDDGSTWTAVETYVADAEKLGEAAEKSIHHRLNCTAFSSGPIVYHMGTFIG